MNICCDTNAVSVIHPLALVASRAAAASSSSTLRDADVRRESVPLQVAHLFFRIGSGEI